MVKATVEALYHQLVDFDWDAYSLDRWIEIWEEYAREVDRSAVVYVHPMGEHIQVYRVIIEDNGISVWIYMLTVIVKLHAFREEKDGVVRYKAHMEISPYMWGVGNG